MTNNEVKVYNTLEEFVSVSEPKITRNENETCWEYYRRTGCVETDAELLLMINELVSTIRSLRTMYGFNGARLVIAGLFNDWLALTGYAQSRKLVYQYP